MLTHISFMLKDPIILIVAQDGLDHILINDLAMLLKCSVVPDPQVESQD